MKNCKCQKCDCPNKISEYGHRYEEENAIVHVEFEHNIVKTKSINQEIRLSCEQGQHDGNPKE